MDRISTAPSYNNNTTWIQHVESMEELKHLLFCASVELETARANAEAQTQLHESRLQHLQELLRTTRRERDEAREQLMKLKQKLGHSTVTNHNSAIDMDILANRGGRSMWPDTKLTNPDDIPSCSNNYMHRCSPSADPVARDSPTTVGLDEIHWNLPENHFDFNEMHGPRNQLQHQPPTSASTDHNADGSNLVELNPALDLQQEDEREPFYQLQQQQQLRLVENSDQQLDSDRLHSLGLEDKLPWQAGMASANGHMQHPSCHLKTGSALASLLSPLDSNFSPPVLPAHLPEPPEADLQVMLSSLPEKGKLLQAVMQAGPLLQTLLLAGPLPQWRHPPPALDAVEIPRISMATSPSLPVGPMAHMSGPHSPALDPCSINSPLSSSHHSPCTRINEPSAALISSLQSGSAPSSSRLVCGPTLNSHDISITGPPLKFAKIH
eukprot:Gb_26573 [translate_table: standard]